MEVNDRPRPHPILLLAIVIIFVRGDLAQEADAIMVDDAPPVADAGEDQLLEGPATVTLDGSGSTDDTGIVSYEWTLVHDGEEHLLGGERAEFVFRSHGEYAVTLNVTDGAGNWDTDELAVEVVTPPGEIETLTAIARNGWVELAWSEPVHDGGSPVTGCVVYRGLTASTLEPYYSDWWIRYWSWDHLAENGRTYHYAVRALNDVGMGPFSPVVNATPVAVPDSPQDLAVEVVDGAVHLSWEPPPWSSGRVNVTGYQVHRGTDPEWLYDTFDAGTDTTFVDDTVEEGQVYYYAVGALSPLGGGAVTEVQEVSLEGEGSEGQGPLAEVLAIAFVVVVLALVSYMMAAGLRHRD